MPSVMPARRPAGRRLVVAGAALCLLTTGCAAGQLNQQQKEKAVSDAGYATRNNMSLQSVFITGPVAVGQTVTGHFVAINGAPAADTLTSVTTSLGAAQLLTTPTGPTVTTATVPGGQGVSPVTYFQITDVPAAMFVGSLFTASFTFATAGTVDVTGTVVDTAPGAYSGDTQQQRGQCLGIIGPNDQGGSQLEGLTATPTPGPECASTTPTPSTAATDGGLGAGAPVATTTAAATTAGAAPTATTTDGTAASITAGPSQSTK